MIVRNNQDLEGLTRIGQICGMTLAYMLDVAEPGMTTRQLDQLGAEYLKKHGAKSAPITAYNYPGWTCISLNDEAAHGIPSDKVIKAGDMLNVDVSALLEGYWADTGASKPIAPVNSKYQRLCKFTKEALYAGIDEAKAGQPIFNIGKAVQRVAKRGRYRIIRELSGHGVGRSIHEDPTIPNFFTRQASQPLMDGVVITIEPFLSMGRGHIVTDKDGWTLRAPDRSIAAQYEHTVVINGDEPILITKVDEGH